MARLPAADQEAVVLELIPLAERVAWRVKHDFDWSPVADPEDLIAQAYEELLHAVAVYDFEMPTRLPFRAFVAVRVRQRLIDHVRREHKRTTGRSARRPDPTRDKGTSTYNVELVSSLVDKRGVFEIPAEEDGFDRVEMTRLAETVRAAVADWSERDQAIVLGPLEVPAATLAEIGARFGVTESRICQVRPGVLARLRRRLENPDAA